MYVALTGLGITFVDGIYTEYTFGISHDGYTDDVHTRVRICIHDAAKWMRQYM